VEYWGGGGVDGNGGGIGGDGGRLRIVVVSGGV